MRRTATLNDQQTLFADWQHHAFVTNRTGRLRDEDLHHRAHAVCELAIRDLKANGLAHCPSGRFNANAAWLALAMLAHNLIRWADTITTGHPRLITTATTRRTLIATPHQIASCECPSHAPVNRPSALTHHNLHS